MLASAMVREVPSFVFSLLPVCAPESMVSVLLVFESLVSIMLLVN